MTTVTLTKEERAEILELIHRMQAAVAALRDEVVSIREQVEREEAAA